MSIERVTPIILQHDDSPFTTMFNDVLQGIKNTSALGVYCYLASKPAGWNLRNGELQRHFDCGRDHINACLKYLKTVGALEIKSLRDEKGKITQWSWNLKRHLPTIRETHILDKPHCGKSAPIKKRSKQIKENNKPPISPLKLSTEDLESDNPFAIPIELIEEWRANRKRFPITKTVWNRVNKVLQQLRERGINPVDAFERMVASGWRSIEVAWFEQEIKAKTVNQVVDNDSMAWGQIEQSWIKQ